MAVPPTEGVHGAGEKDIPIFYRRKLKAINPTAGLIRQAFLKGGEGVLFAFNPWRTEKICLELLDFFSAIRQQEQILHGRLAKAGLPIKELIIRIG